MKILLGVFFIFMGSAYSAYNPFFNNNEPIRRISKPTPVLYLPPPLKLSPPEPTYESKVSQSPVQMNYFGFIESDKGKFALIKVNGKNIVLKENNRVYLNGLSYFVREISSNVVVMEDNEKRVKPIYFSGEMDGKK